MKLTFLTHASQHYNKQTHVLARSIFQHEKGANFQHVAVKGTDGKTYIKGLPNQRFKDVLRLFDEGHECVILIGADCVLFQEMKTLKFELTKPRVNVILTSHVLHPCSNISDYYSTGLAQGDMIAFNNTLETKQILHWLINFDFDVNDKSKGKFYEQTYLSTLPFLFEGVKVLRDETYNVAWFNLHERYIEENQYKEEFLVNALPLTMFHFSGFDINQNKYLSRHSTINASHSIGIMRLIDWYLKQMM